MTKRNLCSQCGHEQADHFEMERFAAVRRSDEPNTKQTYRWCCTPDTDCDCESVAEVAA